MQAHHCVLRGSGLEQPLQKSHSAAEQAVLGRSQTRLSFVLHTGLKLGRLRQWYTTNFGLSRPSHTPVIHNLCFAPATLILPPVIPGKPLVPLITRLPLRVLSVLLNRVACLVEILSSIWLCPLCCQSGWPKQDLCERHGQEEGQVSIAYVSFCHWDSS